MASGAWPMGAQGGWAGLRRRGGAVAGLRGRSCAPHPVVARFPPRCPHRTGAPQEPSRCQALPTCPAPPPFPPQSSPRAPGSRTTRRAGPASRAPGPGHAPSPASRPRPRPRPRSAPPVPSPSRGPAPPGPAAPSSGAAGPGSAPGLGSARAGPAGSRSPGATRVPDRYRCWEATLGPPALMRLLGGAGVRQRGSRLRLVPGSGGSRSGLPAGLGREQPVPRSERRGRRRHGSGSGLAAANRGLPQKLVPPRRLGAGLGAVPAPAGGGEARRGPDRCHRRKAAPQDEG